MDTRLLHLLAGSLLGDGSLECRKRNARYREGNKFKDYMDFKSSILSSLVPITVYPWSRYDPRTAKTYSVTMLRTLTHPLLTEWYYRWYPNGKKVVARSLVGKYLDDFALAIWYCDDGHLSKEGRHIHLYTMCFSDGDVDFLVALLRSRFSLGARWHKTGKGRSVFLPRPAAEDFLRIVTSHVPAVFEYKTKMRPLIRPSQLQEARRRAVRAVELYRTGTLYQREIAEVLDVSPSRVSQWCRAAGMVFPKNYRHPLPRDMRDAVADCNEEIRAVRSGGAGIAQLAKDYNLSKSSIYLICSR